MNKLHSANNTNRGNELSTMEQRRITRSRELRACTECRRRKLKCDRRMPACTSCVKRSAGEATTDCFYANSMRTSSEQKYRSQAEAKLERLESLVQELQQSANGSPLKPARVDPDSLHNGATHWSTMLQEIHELRVVIDGHAVDVGHGDEDDGGDEDDSNNNATGVLFGSTRPLPFQQVLSEFLPPRHEVDRLVGAYFRNRAVVAPFVHSAQFLRTYRLFWDDLSRASPLWTSLLFSILDIAARNVSTGCNRSTMSFDVAAAHCLAIGEYYRPQKNSVEALLLYAHSKCLAGVDLGPDMAVLFGTLVRLATTMGYHRETGGSLQILSAFEREMRRRTWSMCMQLDLLVSFLLGLPSNIQFPTWDTKPPTNLLDSDFDEDTMVLPPARPETEPTELLFYIAKHRLMSVFEKVLRHTLSTTDQTGEELEAIDQEIRATFASLPAVFQARPMAESIVDSPSVKVTRLCVYFIYQKCLCVLHRKYVTRGKEKSLRVCYDSASGLVGRFLDMYTEFESGGQLETERWFMGSITWHDFLLGCTALCFTICYSRRHTADPASIVAIDLSVSLDLLIKAKAVCEEQSAKHKDTKKVGRLIEATIQQFSSQNGGGFTGSSVYNGENELPEVSWPSGPTLPGDNDWSWPENAIDFTNDTAWAFWDPSMDVPN